MSRPYRPIHQHDKTTRTVWEYAVGSLRRENGVEYIEIAGVFHTDLGRRRKENAVRQGGGEPVILERKVTITPWDEVNLEAEL